MIDIRSRLKITRVRKTLMTLSNLKYAKNGISQTNAGTNDITNNTKSFEDYKKTTDTIKSKLPNCKYAISNVIMRKDKLDIEKKVTEFNSWLSKFCSKNKIDIIENENLDGSCLSFKKLHLNKKGNPYLANKFLDFLHSFWFGKSLIASPKTLVSSLKGLYNLRAFYPKNIILSYINVNSIRNKLDDLKLLLGKSLAIRCIS